MHAMFGAVDILTKDTSKVSFTMVSSNRVSRHRSVTSGDGSL